jgi:hypothetical protein
MLVMLRRAGQGGDIRLSENHNRLTDYAITGGGRRK